MLKQPILRPGIGLVVERVIALALAYLLLRSAFAHMGNPYYFLSVVYSYRLTGIGVGLGIALVAPFLQMVLAACLLTRWWLKEAYLLTLVLFLLFVSAQATTLARGLQISCGCFGAAEGLPIGRQTLVLTGVAAVAAFFGWLCTTLLQRSLGANPVPASRELTPEAGGGGSLLAACPLGVTSDRGHQ